MNITVFGTGYVGCVTAACLAELGHHVTGVDPDKSKVDSINAGRSPIVEPKVEELIGRNVAARRLTARCRAEELGQLTLVCVGTPSNENGSLGLDQLWKVFEDIGQLLRQRARFPVIAVRSTMLPGTLQEELIPLLEQTSDRTAGQDFGVCMNPEFMRETSAVDDFYSPPFTVIGSEQEQEAAVVADAYRQIAAPVEFTTIREAEMLKYACNGFHAVKVCFANEIGNVCKRLDVDSHRVMGLLCRDKRLNVSEAYLKPGFAFGGSCLPKDLRAITYKARQLDLDVPLLNSLLESNRKQVERAFDLVRKTGKTRIGVLGLSFKAGTDDLRESPIISLIEAFLSKGLKVKVFDEEVAFARVRGTNRRFIDRVIPHISMLMAGSLREVVEESDVLVISKSGRQFSELLNNHVGERHVIDLVRWVPRSGIFSKYEGLCW